MAFDTYSALQAAVADWLHRTDLTARIPDFIRLAEASINRRLSIFPKEIDGMLVAEIDSRFVALPTDFGSPIQLSSRHTNPWWDIAMVMPTELFPNDDDQGLPSRWAVDGANIAFEKLADQAYPLVLRYYQNLYLSDAQPTTPLFTRAPDLYLYGALAHSAPFLRNDERLPMWQGKFNLLLQEVAAEASRTPGAVPLRTEVPVSTLNRRSDWRS